MKKKVHSSLGIYFTCIIFLIMVLTLLVFISSILLLRRFDFLIPSHRGRLFPLAIIGLISLIVGSTVSAVVTKRILKPIAQLRQAMNQVSQGDFSIELPESQKVEDVQQLYHDFNVMVRELNSIETLRNDFVSTISHEFKTPVATIRGYVQLLQNNQLTPQQKKAYLERMLDGTQQLSQLAENSLKLTKLETQGIHLPNQAFRLDEQIREVILFLQPKWEEQEINLNIELTKVVYVGNEELLYQVWLNLLDNAIKYSPNASTLSVQLVVEEQTIRIAISDEGIGMTQKTLARIFEKFYQADTSRQTKGNGLGLALVKQIIVLHKGTIKVQSQLGLGSTFQVTLPNNRKKQDKNPTSFTNP
ncbi:two-component sensor histidine kinase [Enterococcus florum]|uniref:histidine kinase n=1 Tax=Enterococcus florum TaxID=2480627 RepID=A0A4P5P9E2_9ENTE|nr:HAMP domain-containing sensor histidine kinase [Enterococcus florum]GCF92934.1 two-component sensor histidine kinase [Enterococcus florum]